MTESLSTSSEVVIRHPEDGRELIVSPKAYEILYREQGYELVDPDAYVRPSAPPPPPAQNDHMAEDMADFKKGTAALDPEQTGSAGKATRR
ncbi:MAG: hypothetical protein ABR598_03910 [Candidatus Dormibacteria bacterium]